ncbi:MAG: outer membrane protein transport protein [Gemmatimonadota bacterium]|nr:MAG: outer membrane protein transport protein [Gemmatimonadota bacterium]
MSRSLGVLSTALLLSLAFSETAAAQGFSVNEHGSCVMGRGGTGVALPCADASTILFNPAGIAGTLGWTVAAGVTPIYAGGGFTNDLYQTTDELDNGVVPVPHAYVSYGISSKLAAGFGFFVPYGLGTQWKTDFDGRFLGYDNNLQSMYFQPTLAYDVGKGVKIGAGFDFVVGSLKLTQRADLSEFEAAPGITFGQVGIPFHSEFSDGKLEAHNATGFGGNFGISWDATDWISFGARYMTRVKLDYTGTATFAAVPTGIVLPPGNPLSILLQLPPDQPLPMDAVLEQADLYSEGQPLSDQEVKTSITMPDQGVVGFALRATPKFTFLFDLQWMNWSVFDTLRAEFEYQDEDLVLVENYRDTYGLRFGVDWAATEKLAVRGGYLYHGAAAPDETVTALLPEGVRNEFTLGLGYQFSPMFRADLAYQHLQQNDRRGRTRDALPGQAPTVELNSGIYKFYAHLFGATLSVHF